MKRNKIYSSTHLKTVLMRLEIKPETCLGRKVSFFISKAETQSKIDFLNGKYKNLKFTIYESEINNYIVSEYIR